MDKIKELMSKKVGGVPVALIAALVAAGLLYAAFRMKGSSGDTTATDPTDATGTDAAGDLPDTSQPVFNATPTIFQPSGAGVASVPQSDTNDLWERRALEGLIGAGVPYDVAASALQKYLNGEPLTDEEKAARDKALAAFGVPPEDIPLAPEYPGDEGQDDTPGKKPHKHPHPTDPDKHPHKPPHKDHEKNDHDKDDKHPPKHPHEKHPSKKGHGGNGGGRHIDGHGEGNKAYVPVATRVAPVQTEAKVTRATTTHNTAKHIAAKNGTTEDHVKKVNPHLSFPVRPGTMVRVR